MERRAYRRCRHCSHAFRFCVCSRPLMLCRRLLGHKIPKERSTFCTVFPATRVSPGGTCVSAVSINDCDPPDQNRVSVALPIPSRILFGPFSRTRKNTDRSFSPPARRPSPSTSHRIVFSECHHTVPPLLLLLLANGCLAACPRCHAFPGVLKDQVCSPGGTTIAAVEALEKNGFRAAAMSAVVAATNKSLEMRTAKK